MSVKRRTSATLVCTLTLAAIGLSAPRQDAGSRSRESAEPPATTAAASRPLAALLLGTFHGTVVDDDETVPCVTTFADYRGRPAGMYLVRAGKPDQYEGALDGYSLLSEERRECRFRWHDKNGEGFVTVRVSEDGNAFAGSWGLEVVQEKLVWTGQREAPTTRRAGQESRSR